MLTKKHFDTVANIIREARELNTSHDETRHIIRKLADYFQSENPRFDRVRFGNACVGQKIE